jgi:hypothetical protein
MDTKSKVFLHVQDFIGQFTIVIIAPLYFLLTRIFFYRVRDLREIRRQSTAEFAKHKGPWIICANHLTMVDSFLLSYATFSLRQHITGYRRLPWNLPERRNFQSNILLILLCYLSKCIPVDRGGPREKMKETLDKCEYLLRNGHTVMIFPEGGRSRSGRVDKEGFSYGVGRFVHDVEDCKVMCIYMRGDKQDSYSGIPAWGDKFSAQVEVFTPERIAETGLRAQREYATQIINRLAQMEDNYFAARRERCRGFEGFCKQKEKHGFALPEENPHR